MASKYQYMAALSEHTAQEITGNPVRWLSFLNTAASVYKYPFNDQLMIYAQRPDTPACATMEVWNRKMNRWVNRGAKGIALIDDTGPRRQLKYVFDIRDTHLGRFGKTPYLWRLKEEHTDAIRDHLIDAYGLDADTQYLRDALMETARLSVMENLDMYFADFRTAVEGSFLEELDELNQMVRFRETLINSVQYMLLYRCGLGPENTFDTEDFSFITDFNTLAAVSQIGFATSEIAKTMQKPDATLLAGYSGWQKKFQRHVNAGEQGIKIFAPAPVKVRVEKEKKDPDTGLPELDETGDPVTETVEIRTPKFKVVTVFDVSQTDGKPLPTLGIDELTGSVEHYDQFFEALTRTATVPIGFEAMDDGSNGYYHLEEKRIAIREGMSEAQTVKTTIHELAHSRLHDFDRSKPPAEGEDRPDRFTREVQAESVAYVVCQHFGIDTSDYSFGYVATWSADRELPELKASLQTIRDAASSLITEIEQNLTVIQQERENDQEKYEWNFYVVPDLMTWARPELFGGRTDIEQFTSFSDAAARFRELRTENYNFEDAKNDDGIPYARLTLGIQREDPPSAVDLLHVRAGKNVLCEDFKSMDTILSSPEAMAALQTVASQLGFEEVLSHRSMTDAEIHDFTYDHFKYDLERGSVPHIESYLASFEQLYSDGQLDRLKPSVNQQQITELLDFSTWDNPYFEVQDTPERLTGDLAVLMSQYDPYGAQQYAEILDSITGNNVSYLKEWLSSVAAEGEEFSEPARKLMQRLDDMTAAPEIVEEIPAAPQKEPDPKEALYEINGRYLHIQKAADGGWDYTYYNPFMEVLDGSQVGDAAMDFQQGRAEILGSLNLSNVPLTGVPVSRLQELMEKRENDLRCPVYYKDLIQARADGEMDQWHISHHATETCAEQFRKEYGKAYHARQVPEFLHQMVDRYGIERCKIVIASTIQLAPEDGRYSPNMKAAAAKVMIPGASENHLHDRRRDYWVNCHPVMVNIAMRDLLEIERQSQENGKTPKEAEKAAGKKPSIRKKLERNKAIIAAGSDKEQQNTRSNPQLY